MHQSKYGTIRFVEDCMSNYNKHDGGVCRIPSSRSGLACLMVLAIWQEALAAPLRATSWYRTGTVPYRMRWRKNARIIPVSQNVQYSYEYSTSTVWTLTTRGDRDFQVLLGVPQVLLRGP